MKNIVLKYDNSYILQYDADFPSNIFDEINSYQFMNFKNFILEKEINTKTEKNEKKSTTKIQLKYTNQRSDYDTFVKLNFDSLN